MPDSYKGLSSKEAEKLLEKYGPNSLPESPPPSDLKIFLDQVKSPLVYVLIAAGVTTLFLHDPSDAIIIFVAVVINTLLGFIQERKASRALDALKKLIHPTAKVIRDGKQKEIDVDLLVPGDVVVLSQGDKIPADGVLLEANRLFCEEAILTGESVPVGKKEKSEIFMGTIVSSGRGIMKVVSTGQHTQMGKIAARIGEPEEDTPLKKQLTRFSKQLTYLVFSLTVIVFIFGILSGKDPLDIFTTAVSLAVSSIPEGLLVALTVILAIGMQRILRRKGLVRNLTSAETLGGVTTICVDKTGTLTKGKMKVSKWVGTKSTLQKQMIIANDMDDPIVIAARHWATNDIKNDRDLISKHKRLDSIPFSSENKFFATLNKGRTKNSIYINGAPEVLLEYSVVAKQKKEKYKREIEKLAKDGMRVIGLAQKKVSSKKTSLQKKDIKSGLKFVGLIALADPVRRGVSSALEKTQSAGIKLFVITGDYPDTAISVMKKLNLKLNPKNLILGEELKHITGSELAKQIVQSKGVHLFARTSPEQKLKIVEALKSNGEVVAMMGDGVNDAPALKKSDIGIVVGEATDVAKETADLVLLDSSFATIVAAIEEGRSIFDNTRKVILYLMSDAFEEIFAVLATMLLSLPLPVTAVQILWINLISDGLPNLALTVDPKRKGIMDDLPRSPKEPIVSSWMKALIMIVSTIGGAMAFLVFVYVYMTSKNEALARSICFAVLGLNSLVYVFSVRTLKDPFWKANIFANKWLTLSVFGGLVLQFTPFLIRSVGDFVDVTPLEPIHYLIIFGSSFLMFIIIEGSKSLFRHSLK